MYYYAKVGTYFWIEFIFVSRENGLDLESYTFQITKQDYKIMKFEGIKYRDPIHHSEAFKFRYVEGIIKLNSTINIKEYGYSTYNSMPVDSGDIIIVEDNNVKSLSTPIGATLVDPDKGGMVRVQMSSAPVTIDLNDPTSTSVCIDGVDISVNEMKRLKNIEDRYNKILDNVLGGELCPTGELAEICDHDHLDASQEESEECKKCWEVYLDKEIYSMQIEGKIVDDDTEEPFDKEKYEKTAEEAIAIFKDIE